MLSLNLSPTALLFSLPLLVQQHAEAWTIVPSSQLLATGRVEQTRLFMVQSTTINQKEVAARIVDADRGRSTSPSEQEDLETYFSQLEEKCSSLKAPARSPFVQGSWVVEYTTAPAPSNGQLGPFRGIAYQEVDLESGRYANILRVPPNDWLSATLEASWVEWDGELIEDDDSEGKNKWTGTTTIDDDETKAQEPKSNPSFMDALSGMFPASPGTTSKSEDYGATCWVVTFETITIRLFGIPLINQNFNNVKRVWRTTYVDENTRIVRAGRTGKQDDEMLFYMTRV